MKLAVFDASKYTDANDARLSGALYEQNSEWSYDTVTGIKDLLEIVDALNRCHNGASDQPSADFVITVLEEQQWLPLQHWVWFQEQNFKSCAYKPTTLAAREPTFIGTINGFSFYEHPDLGDDVPLLIVLGSIVAISHWCDLPTPEDLPNCLGHLEQAGVNTRPAAQDEA